MIRTIGTISLETGSSWFDVFYISMITMWWMKITMNIFSIVVLSEFNDMIYRVRFQVYLYGFEQNTLTFIISLLSIDNQTYSLRIWKDHSTA